MVYLNSLSGSEPQADYYNCKKCGEHVPEADIRDKGCIHCIKTCEGCEELNSDIDIHFVECQVKVGDKWMNTVRCEKCFECGLQYGELRHRTKAYQID